MSSCKNKQPLIEYPEIQTFGYDYAPQFEYNG